MPIPCTVSTAYLSQNGVLYAEPYGAGSTSFHPVGPADLAYNAMGYDPLNGYLYAVEQDPVQDPVRNELLRIDPTTGAATDLGQASPSLDGNIIDGTFDPAGHFFVMDPVSTTLTVIDVNTLAATSITTSQPVYANDFTYGPGGYLWGGTATHSPANSIVRVDPTTGSVDFFPAPAGMDLTGVDPFGADFTYANGDIGFSANYMPELFRVAIANPSSATPTFTLVSTQTVPNASDNDGASCIAPTTMTGRAYGLAAAVSVLGASVPIPPVTDTGPVTTTASALIAPACIAHIGGVVSADAICASVSTTAVPSASTSTASVAQVSVGVPGIPVITLKALQATSTTSCSGSTGSTTIAYLAVGTTVLISKATTVGPNTTLVAGLVKVVLNEQKPVAGPDAGLTVNAAHISASALGLASADVVVASAESDIGNCP